METSPASPGGTSQPKTDERRVPRVALGDDGYAISQLIVGGWQLSRGHRQTSIDEPALFRALASAARQGWTTFDCADIYTGVEELFGRFRQCHEASLRGDGIELQFHTKYVPDLDDLASLTRDAVEQVVDRSLRRLKVERLDLVQFSWWDYDVPGYVDAARWLADLRATGKIRHVGATNFDTQRMREMLDAGVQLVSNQVQYSLLDRRPEHGLASLADERGFGLLCYGALAGGFLSERFREQPPPPKPLPTRSLTKYRLIVEEAGGWERLQDVLRALDAIARRRDSSSAAVALRWLLERPSVTAAMVGTFDGSHLERDLDAISLGLTAADIAEIDGLTARLTDLAGDVFDLERAPDGPHSQIMWKNLSRR